MSDKYMIEEWEDEHGNSTFSVFELVGRWPFRKWELRCKTLKTEATALKYIEQTLLPRPRLLKRRFLNADMSEDYGW